MEDMWVHPLQEVEGLQEREFKRTEVLKVFNGKQEMVLVDTKCGPALVRQVQRPCTPELMLLKCIHSDIKEYLTVAIHLQVARKCFHCVVGVVSHLDCSVLLQSDCPLLPWLL